MRHQAEMCSRTDVNAASSSSVMSSKQRQPGNTAPASSSREDPWDIHQSTTTTFKLGGLPCRLDGHELSRTINSLGFEGKYDLLYLVLGGKARSGAALNVGYGFVNFISSEDAERFRVAFDGYVFPNRNAMKQCVVEPAQVQGLTRSLEVLHASSRRNGLKGFLICSL
uniref:Mei2-like C-terminal RNA recognition motif domain-containing protein n=1 Tax=Alexandrium monilatum TaxID=311494 RepID=A0A7S4QE60_9DINO|mmetsp:Transcript_42022/g.125731  ORF Transcript_42022/g.125731 Transcript_42022/m.125731 type:complete len:168 (+) Transcript_42022:50-553(+)